MTLQQLIDAYCRDRERAGVKASSLRIYRTRLSGIARTLGPRPLAEITRQDWLDVLHAATLKADGTRLAPDTIALTYTLVGSIQAYALDEDLLATPWLKSRDLKKPKGQSRERTATEDETTDLLAEMTPAYRRLYQCLRLTGARRSELVRAQIRDLDGQPPARRIVLADHKAARSQGKPRIIYLGAEADAIIRKATGYRRKGHIFLDDDGQPWQPDRVTKIFARLRDELGLPRSLKLHCTRHEFATRMVERHGLQAAAQACGHAGVSTTQKYAHLTGDYLQRCVSGLYEDDAA